MHFLSAFVSHGLEYQFSWTYFLGILWLILQFQDSYTLQKTWVNTSISASFDLQNSSDIFLGTRYPMFRIIYLNRENRQICPLSFSIPIHRSERSYRSVQKLSRDSKLCHVLRFRLLWKLTSNYLHVHRVSDLNCKCLKQAWQSEVQTEDTW